MSSDVLASVFDVRDQVVLVTGGASGLGLAIARVLAECGAIVVIADWDESRLANAADGHAAGARIEQALLASPASSFMTGGVYPVDGGQLLQSPPLASPH